ncbi:hypothetical protein IRY55_05075 [Savagea sp. SN6]|uniref:Uncharacterized protein n=1 Tax=Savagea serpentis TaxID=2785297 RepID=A0A8J7G5I8_9BACL|nr:hypothetical protein [Savagea serpentis]MBF4500731.1 hypothetical protein [Savagea serpentis]
MRNIEGAYGTNQNWLATYGETTPFWAARACGVAAAANVLLQGEQVTERQAAAFMGIVFRQMKPKWWGMPSMHRWLRHVQTLAQLQGRAVQMSKPHATNADALRQFIEQSLQRGEWVVVLHWFHPIKMLRYHWVTITASNQQGLTLSSWGRRYTFSWEDWFQQSFHAKYVGIKLI